MLYLKQLTKLVIKLFYGRGTKDPRDWANPGVESIVNHVVKNAKSGDIVLLHGGGNDCSQAVAALAKILPDFHKQDYRFVKVSE